MYRIVIAISLVASAVFGQTTNMTVVPAQTNAAVGIDWRYGRPGVFVVTNAAPAVTNVLAQRTITINGVPGSPVSNLVFDVEGGVGGGGVSAVEATNIATWVSSLSTQNLVRADQAAVLATNAALSITATNRVKRLYYDRSPDTCDWLDGNGSFWRNSFVAAVWYLWTPNDEEVPVSLTGYPPDAGNWSGGDYVLTVYTGVDGNENTTDFRSFTVMNTVSGESWHGEFLSGYSDSFLIPPAMIATEPIELFSNGGGAHVIDRAVRTSELTAWHTTVTNSTFDVGTNTVVAGTVQTPQIAFLGTSVDFLYGGLAVASVEYDGVGVFDRLSLTGTDPEYAPLIVGTSTMCANLNADLLDGLHASSFQTLTGNPGVAFTNLAVDVANSAVGTLQTGGSMTNASIVTLDVYGKLALNGTNIYPYSDIGELTKDPSGWVDPLAGQFTMSATTLTYTNATPLQFLVAGSPQSVDFVPAEIPATRGNWYVYIDSGTKNVVVSQTPWDLYDIQIAVVHRNGGSTNLVSRETHGVMPWQTHRRFHMVPGSASVYASGFNLYANNSVFTNSSGVWFDEDLMFAVDQTNTARVAWRDGSSGYLTFTQPRTTYYPTNATGALVYDNGGSLSTVSVSSYMSMWLYITGIVDCPYVWIAGRSSGALADIRTEQPPDLGAYFPVAESVLLYRVILRNQGGTPQYVETTDYRLSRVTGASYTPTSHATLSGRDLPDQHPTSAITGLDAALLSAGGATNLVLNGATQTYDSGTRTLSGTVPMVYSTITNLPVVVAGATNVVTLGETYATYVITATNAVNVMTNVNGGFSLSGRRAEWELWVNFTNPSGTNMTWCPCMQWDTIPDISVTGLYKFACSTIDGVVVTVRQIEPVTQPRRVLVASETGNASMGSGVFTIMADSATNDYLYLPTEDPSKPILVKMSYYGSVAGVRTNAVTITPGTAISGVTEQWTNTVVATICTNSAISQVISFLLPSIDSLCTGGTSSYAGWEGNFGTRYSLWFNRKSPGTGVVVSRALLYRTLNELETKAYDAGWRP